jgi:hypothetical protein
MGDFGRVEALDRLIDGYLRGDATFEAFAAGYASTFISLPDDAFPDVGAEVWYGVLHERAERAAPDPSPDARRYGWMSIDELRAWLADYAAARSD